MAEVSAVSGSAPAAAAPAANQATFYLSHDQLTQLADIVNSTTGYTDAQRSQAHGVLSVALRLKAYDKSDFRTLYDTIFKSDFNLRQLALDDAAGRATAGATSDADRSAKLQSWYASQSPRDQALYYNFKVGDDFISSTDPRDTITLSPKAQAALAAQSASAQATPEASGLSAALQTLKDFVSVLRQHKNDLMDLVFGKHIDNAGYAPITFGDAND